MKQDSQYDALIFDLDGTLWDSTHPVAHAWNRALSHIGVHARFSHQDVAGIMGMPVDEIFAKFFPGVALEQRDTIAERCLTEEIHLLRQQGAALYPGVAEGLSQLAKSYPLFIVSNCQSEYMDTFLRVYPIEAVVSRLRVPRQYRQRKADNIRAVKDRNSLPSRLYWGYRGRSRDRPNAPASTTFMSITALAGPRENVCTSPSSLTWSHISCGNDHGSPQKVPIYFSAEKVSGVRGTCPSHPRPFRPKSRWAPFSHQLPLFRQGDSL